MICFFIFISPVWARGELLCKGYYIFQNNLISPFLGYIPNKVGNNPNWCDTTNATVYAVYD